MLFEALLLTMKKFCDMMLMTLPQSLGNPRASCVKVTIILNTEGADEFKFMEVEGLWQH
jgi:hypothetical protein